jgi:hypothetical protein
MIRTLKALLLAAVAVTALGAIWASAVAQAHTPPEFHCDVEPCSITGTPDGTGKTAHHVFDVKLLGQSLPITCNELTFDATQDKKTATTVTATGLVYHGCTFLSAPATVSMNGCHYLLHASTEVTVQCPAGKEITFEAGSCQVHVPAQGPLKYVHYHNIKPGSVEEVTVEPTVTGIHGVATLGCPVVGTFTEGEYTTGNTIATGEEDKANPAMVNVRWTDTVA